ncbi:hypothetical protein Deima_1974 [Deinococcus maricopensis DSM 21211]|uniref:Uncharacterized protein n=1 Tax=Deinococcus maricopensis (strain DSM 21211 / LMG 22137 / NRRL B-23946 / LB-34) TaxID=709986 RepID=E8U980_DEIML|nr:hypothetical protein Deima_1974 [Deinococcus maricopensis DSM 21211]
MTFTPRETTSRAPSAMRPPYQKPTIKPLGAWTNVTLAISVPIGPGSRIFYGLSNPQTPQDT